MKKNILSLMPGKPMLAAIVSVFFMGFSPVLVRMTDVGPFAIGFYRMYFALIFLYIWSLLEKDTRAYQKLSGIQTKFWVVLASILLALDLGFAHMSVGYTELVNVALFNNMMPIFMPFLLWFFYSRPPNWRFLLAAGISVIGAMIVIGEGLTVHWHQLKGNILALLGAFFYACYMIVVAKIRRSMSASKLTVWMTFLGGIFMLVFAMLSGEKIILDIPQDWIVLIALAITSQVISLGLITYAAGFLSEGLLSVMCLLATVVAGIGGWILFDEQLSMWQFIGGIVVIGSIVYARYAENLLAKRYEKNEKTS